MPALSSDEGVVSRYVRIELPGADRILSLAEFEAYSGKKKISQLKPAYQKSTFGFGDANRANDGNTSGSYSEKSTTHTQPGTNVWWEMDLGRSYPITKLILYNRTDCCGARINPARIILLDDERKIVWESRLTATAPKYEIVVDATIEEARYIKRNLLRNATFNQRTNPPIPDYWDLHHAAALVFPDLHQQYYVDENIDPPVDGASVIKIVNSREDFSHVILLPRKLFRRVPEGVYTFSVYARSDSPGAEFNVARGWAVGERLSRKVTSSWQRFSFTFNLPASEADTLQPILTFPKKGAYYISAPQLEPGSSASVFSPAYMDSFDIYTGQGTGNVNLEGVKDKFGRLSLVNEEKLLTSTFEYDYYTDESLASLRLSSRYETEIDVDVVCREHGSNRKPITLLKKRKLLPQATQIVNIPISGLVNGSYACETVLLNDGVKRILEVNYIRKLKPHAVEVKVNNHKRYIVVNGQPFYMIGIALAVGASVPNWYLREIKEQGINTLFYNGARNSKGRYDIKKIRTLIRNAAKHEIKVVIGRPLAGEKPHDWRNRLYDFYELVKLLKNEPNLIGWYPVDEPSSASWHDDELVEIYSDLKSLDPYRLVFVNWAYDAIPRDIGKQPRGTLGSSDIYSFDYYPFAGVGRSMGGFTNTTLRVLESARIYNKITHSWLQLFGGMTAWREPSGDELNYMAYLNYVYGGMISYFDTKSNSNETWARISSINKEGETLARLLFLSEDAVMIAPPVVDEEFIFSVWKKQNDLFVIVVNGTEAPATYIYSPPKEILGECSAAVYSIFEKNEVLLVDEQIKERFPAYGSRAYKVMCK